MADQPSPGTTSVPSYETEAPRRERAPTITVDTSAVSPPGAGQDVVPRRQSTSTAGDQPILNVDFSGARTPTGSVYGRNGSISDGMDSRPTSPHNVSSPTARNYEQNFLAVPGERSRGNSVTSDDLSPTQTHFSAGPDAPVNSPAAMNGDAKAPDKKAKDVGRPVFVDDDDDGDALKPDPGTEADFEVSDNKFAFTPGHMGKMYNPKSHAAFYALGGLRGIEMGLQTDRHAGLSVDETVLDRRISFDEVKERVHSEVSPTDTSAAAAKDWDASETTAAARTSAGDGAPENGPFADRRRVFNENRLPKKKTKSILQLAWIAYKDKILILLSFAALISLALGIYQSVGGLHAPDEPAVEWVEGVAIVVAIFIVVSVGALNDWQKERQFVKLNKKKEDRVVKVIRSGRSQEMSVYDLLVGDVMHLEPGDLIPVDGVLVDGDGVRCDESSATGESDIIKKTPAEMVYRAIEEHRDVRKLDPFILSGAKVNEGIGTFVVTAVGVNSTHGKTLIALREDMEATPLQIKLNKLAEQIAKLGGAAALLLFVVLFIKFLVQLPRNSDPPAQKGRRFMRILITAITVIVVAVPEGLPLAVTLALAFATTRMLKDNNLVRVLRACETMGNATTICSDKTGTLTQNKMTVVAGTVGLSSRFEDRDLAASAESDEAGAQGAEGSKPVAVNHGGGDDLSSSSSAHGLIAELSPDAKSALLQSIVLNSTAFEGEDDGKPTFVGSKTETALLLFARDHLGLQSLSVERANAQVVQSVPFDSGRKCMATVVRLDDGRHRMYVKGASEIMLAKCSAVVPRPTTSAETAPMTSETAEALNQLITSYASRSLRTIGLLYQDYEKWPPTGTASEENADKADFDRVFRNMTFLAVVGIQDPLRVGVRNAVRRCQKAGVFVRMVTGDNLITARAIAQQCGIYTEGGIIMEGPKFRKLSKRDMDRTIPRLQVLARSSPEDKRILVKRLKELGETVAVTGDGTNDAPALKTADIGFSMGIAGTEVAKEASAIILMDDNFASIVKAMMWGRAVNDAVRKFLQFQLTVNITAVLLTFISAVSNENQESVLKAVQLLWVNLIMDTFAALALATDPPTDSILERRPDRKSAPLISITMWKMILGQAVFQLVVTLIIYYAGTEIFDYETAEEIDRLPTLVFNTFVWMQIFNMVNNRRLDNKYNIFEGILRNRYFLVIMIIMIGGQALIVNVGGAALAVKPLDGAQWGFSILFGAISIPIGVVIRLIPDSLLQRLIPSWLHRKRGPQVVVTDDEHRFEWNEAIETIREELAFLKTVRGGRLNAIRFKLQHPRETLIQSHMRSRSNSRSSSMPQTPTGDNMSTTDFTSSSHAADSRPRKRARSRSNSAFGPAAAMAGVVAGSIAGWSPIDRSQSESGAGVRSFSPDVSGRAELEAQEGVQVHPRTSSTDPVITDDTARPPASDVPPSQIAGMTPSFDTARRTADHQQP